MGSACRHLVRRAAGLLPRAAVALAMLCRPPPASAQPQPAPDSRLPRAGLHEQVLRLPGDPARPAMLEVTLYSPGGPGPFPLAIVNHGANQASPANRGERNRFTVAAYYFLSRGYAVALPMMRGFSQSEGDMVLAGCDLAAVAQGNARDMRAVIEALGRRPGIDRTRIVVTGQSFGAWNTLGLGVAPPPGVRGLVAFNAALRTSDCPRQDAAMADGAAQLGARTRLPSLWFYGDNDIVMPTPAWRAVFGRYQASGAPAELVAIGPYRTDSHQFLSDAGSLPLWGAKLDAFLARIGLPSTLLNPGYLPHPVPPPTDWAALTDAAALPYVGVRGHAIYQRFLASAKPRAIAVAPNGAVSTSSGGYDPVGVALENCARTSPRCRLYAVDDDVVWSPLLRTLAKTVRMGTTTALGAFYSVNPDCTLKELPRLVVAEAPGHGRADVARKDEHPAFPAGSRYAVCNAAAVAAMQVSYTPAPGYTGTDTLMLERTDQDGRQMIRVDLRVM